ncbi:autophagy associated WD repeat protein Atg18a [Schizosaccharomyces osmophilus]|uniref:Autophagy associated WD repeat protein Atg18a n=1 Tax=Schizosaccharomyces osmophilus TaxID=2545709 RepID=A0AAE9W8D4_9SCHI|nr:autophagy associated WD repeat protein Atg18a [Schizosaccharomyces osmophilus]WBW71594.1 autophagy associated WD repeat protein Atg18a [Schizosaccharomyces osmophilus]
MASNKSHLLFCGFNQDSNLLSVGTYDGYKIYNCDPFGKCFFKLQGATSIVEMLFSTSLVALVEKEDGNNRKLKLVNTKKGTTICELTFPTPLLSVKLNRKRLLAVLEEQIYVYDISNMLLLHTIETCGNLFSVCALSPNSANCYLAYPDTETKNTRPELETSSAALSSLTVSGRVIVWDAVHCKEITVIQAHKDPLSILEFNADGTMLATASENGRIIRVYSIPSGERLYQFRRGSLPAQVYSIAFHPDSTLLAVSSSTQTVHIYRLSSYSLPSKPQPVPSSTTQPRRESLFRRSSRSIVGTVGGYLPQSVSGMLDPERDFAFAHIPGDKVSSTVAFSGENSNINVATFDGNLYTFRINTSTGGECSLINHFSIGLSAT